MKQKAKIFGFALLVAAAEPAAAKDSGEGLSQPCVEVQIGEDTATHLNCVNAEIERRVAREHDSPPPAAPVDARSQSNRVGAFNESVTRQMMGNSFGVSPKPQRPQQSFGNPHLPNVPR